jgi:hypothetical protein
LLGRGKGSDIPLDSGYRTVIVVDMNITVHEAAYHRNGIAGEPFYACHFTDHDCDGEEREFIATVFPPPPLLDGEPDWFGEAFHSPRVAVLALDKLPDVRFIYNSWRWDRYADALYRFIADVD